MCLLQKTCELLFSGHCSVDGFLLDDHWNSCLAKKYYQFSLKAVGLWLSSKAFWENVLFLESKVSLWIEICNQITIKKWLPSISQSSLFNEEKVTFFYLTVRNCVTLVQPLKKAKAEMLGTGAGKYTCTFFQGWADVLTPAGLYSSALQCSGKRGGFFVHLWASTGTSNVDLMLLKKSQLSLEMHLHQEVPKVGNMASLTWTQHSTHAWAVGAWEAAAPVWADLALGHGLIGCSCELSRGSFVNTLSACAWSDWEAEV